VSSGLAVMCSQASVAGMVSQTLLIFHNKVPLGCPLGICSFSHNFFEFRIQRYFA
jgi:hypothetical protein